MLLEDIFSKGHSGYNHNITIVPCLQYRPLVSNSKLYKLIKCSGKDKRSSLFAFRTSEEEIGLHQPLDGVTNPKYRLQCFLKNYFFSSKRRRHQLLTRQVLPSSVLFVADPLPLDNSLSFGFSFSELHLINFPGAAFTW